MQPLLCTSISEHCASSDETSSHESHSHCKEGYKKSSRSHHASFSSYRKKPALHPLKITVDHLLVLPKNKSLIMPADPHTPRLRKFLQNGMRTLVNSDDLEGQNSCPICLEELVPEAWSPQDYAVLLQKRFPHPDPAARATAYGAFNLIPISGGKDLLSLPVTEPGSALPFPLPQSSSGPEGT